VVIEWSLVTTEDEIAAWSEDTHPTRPAFVAFRKAAKESIARKSASIANRIPARIGEELADQERCSLRNFKRRELADESSLV